MPPTDEPDEEDRVHVRGTAPGHESLTGALYEAAAAGDVTATATAAAAAAVATPTETVFFMGRNWGAMVGRRDG